MSCESSNTQDHHHHHDPPPEPPADAWKNTGVQVIPSDQLDENTAQTPGMNRAAAINFARVGAQKLWAGTVTIHADAKTGAHHHGKLPRLQPPPPPPQKQLSTYPLSYVWKMDGEVSERCDGKC